MLQQLRYGRGLDNRALKQSGYRFSLTTREAVQAFGEALRLAPLRDNGEAPYRYEREVEEFLRWLAERAARRVSRLTRTARLAVLHGRRAASYHLGTACVPA